MDNRQPTVQITEYMALGATSGLNTQHRFQGIFPGVLGEIAWRELDIGEPLPPLAATDRLYTLGVLHLLGRLQAASNVFGRYAPADIGLVLGGTTYGIEAALHAVCRLGGSGVGQPVRQSGPGEGPVVAAIDPRRRFSAVLNRDMQADTLFQSIRRRYPVHGYMGFLSNACASGALAVGSGAELLRVSPLKAVIAGGFDVLNEVTIRGFSALQVLAEFPSQPFEKSTGMNLAEGGALFLLEKESEPAEAGRAQGVVLGHYVMNEGHHLTQPMPGGEGMVRCMRGLLTKLHRSPEEIRWISCHASGTPANDVAEKAALDAVFGQEWPARALIAKGLVGHCLGGAGALELALALSSRSEEEGLLLKNSFGFGGSNVSLLVARRRA